MIGWLLFGLLLCWHVVSKLHGGRKRIRLNAYVMLLLLQDESARDHQSKFKTWVRQSGADRADELFERGSRVIQSMADELWVLQDAPLILAVRALLLDCRRNP